MDFRKSQELIEELTEDILDIRIGYGCIKTGRHYEITHSFLVAHEKSLSKLESNLNDVKLLEKFEKELLEQFKQHDRLLHMMNMNNPSATTKISNMAMNRGRILKREELLGNPPNTTSTDALVEMGDGELLQLQDRIINQQDQQLDSLSQVLGRQKKIGELIGQTLDEQVDMLDAVDERVDIVQNGLDSASNRVGTFMAASASDSSLCYTIIGLFILLILVIYLTRMF